MVIVFIGKVRLLNLNKEFMFLVNLFFLFVLLLVLFG